MHLNKEDYLSDIKSVSIFKDLSEDDIKEVLKLAFVKEYGNGFHIFRKDMMGGIMYVILRGEATVFITGDDRKEKVLAIIGPNSYIGEMSIIEETPRSASCVVSKPSIMLVITKKCFDDIQEKYPKIGLKVLKAILITVSQRLRICNEKLSKFNEAKEF
ncbi:cyclic nucleotide-binding domain-containing protein [candidate division WOR-3 bacterium]|nr:cyclic nucleotide-binding domain-containing protein [candidate division WOR-3 bacterium]